MVLISPLSTRAFHSTFNCLIKSPRAWVSDKEILNGILLVHFYKVQYKTVVYLINPQGQIQRCER